MRKLSTAFTSLYLLNMIGGSAAADQQPHPGWNLLGFRSLTDSNPDPLSAFILALDPDVFKNPAEISSAIIAKCTQLATTSVDSWDNESVWFQQIKKMPGGAWRTQADMYTTFENNVSGELPSTTSIACIEDILKPYIQERPILDWDPLLIACFAIGLILAATCVAKIAYHCIRQKSTSSLSESTSLFVKSTDVEAGYGTSTVRPPPEVPPPSYDEVTATR